MGQRKYKVVDRSKKKEVVLVEYHGFDRKVKDALFIAVATIDGQTEVFATDNTGEAIVELQRYFTNTYGTKNVPVHMFGFIHDLNPTPKVAK